MEWGGNVSYYQQSSLNVSTILGKGQGFTRMSIASKRRSCERWWKETQYAVEELELNVFLQEATLGACFITATISRGARRSHYRLVIVDVFAGGRFCDLKRSK
ncbi:hypothetical protein KM043_008264 [Ampulex compressa]|nr:hypothetical protein KM043_008264 [Ampulex compressa]